MPPRRLDQPTSPGSRRLNFFTPDGPNHLDKLRIAEGRLKAYRIGNGPKAPIRIDVADLDALLVPTVYSASSCAPARSARRRPRGRASETAQAGAQSRARTMAKVALHRLADTSLPGLRIGLDAADECVLELGQEMTGMRLAAEREAAARRTRGLAGPGAYETAYRSAPQHPGRLHPHRRGD